MLKNYFKIAFRTLVRNKGYAFINILGLAIGITGATLLLTYVQDENSFDRFHSKSDRIVRTVLTYHHLDGERFYGENQPVLAKTLVDELPEVEDATTLQKIGNFIDFEVDGVRFAEDNYFMVGSDFLRVFDFNLLQGNKTQVLSKPNSVVLTERMANRLFGKSDVVGQTVTIAYVGECTITGIAENTPMNSHLQFDMLISPLIGDEEWWEPDQKDWSSFSGASYFVLAPNTDLNSFTEKVNKLAGERMGKKLDDVYDYSFQPLHNIHFGSKSIEKGLEASKGDKSYIIIFRFIAIFLLLIASVNYMNLATSKAVFRAKEIGIRKVVGAAKKQLIAQFLVESILIALLALLISIEMMDITMPFFNQLTGKEFEFSWATLGDYLPMLMTISVLIGLVSGIYPSFFILRYMPVEALKGENKGDSFSLRKALVIFQFIISIVLIITTLVVQNQMSFIQEKDLGFNDENLLVIDISGGEVREKFKTMRSEFSRIPGVQSVGVSTRVPGEWKTIFEVQASFLDNKGSTGDSSTVYYMGFDYGMKETFGFRVKEGAYFSGNDQADSLKVLINEEAVKAFALTNPVGTMINLKDRGMRVPVQVIGVLENFNFKSIHNKVEPIIIGAWNNPSGLVDYFTLKVTGNLANVIEKATLIHEKFDKETAIEYHLLENQRAAFYKKESQANAIFKLGAGLSVFVACLGLFGLTSFSVQKRIKEIGIRKVLGASHWSLFYMLSTSFIRQVMLAFLIASPIAYILMNNWLQKFAYRIDVGLGVFLTAGLAAVIVALITVSYRSVIAANSNPVKALKSE